MQVFEAEIKTKRFELDQARQLVADDFFAVDQMILAELKSEVSLVNETTEHVVKSGGKRLRPLLVLLIAKALGYAGDNEHHELATVIEFIHTATLLHDDVVDESLLRRGKPTANAQFGNQAAVLAGDFLYARAFQILARRHNIPIMKILADTTSLIAEGEVLQLMNCGNSDLTEIDYLKVIQRKTAQLYAAAAETAALVATGNDPAAREIGQQYGLHLGMAFQMIDDLLDYTADTATIGKHIGDDLAEGKMTLPLIYALQHGSIQQQHVIQHAIQSKGRSEMSAVIAAINDSQGCHYTFECAKKEAQLAKQYAAKLPNNAFRAALMSICDFVLLRGH